MEKEQRMDLWTEQWETCAEKILKVCSLLLILGNVVCFAGGLTSLATAGILSALASEDCILEVSGVPLAAVAAEVIAAMLGGLAGAIGLVDSSRQEYALPCRISGAVALCSGIVTAVLIFTGHPIFVTPVVLAIIFSLAIPALYFACTIISRALHRKEQNGMPAAIND